MSPSIDSPAADRAAGPIRSAVLLAGLAAIVFVSYGLVAPLPPGWSAWRLPIGIAAAGGLALLLAWPSRRAATKTRTVDEVARMLGVASAVLGIGAAMLVAIGLTLNIAENRTFTTQSLIYQLTHHSVLISMLAIATPAAITGALGLAIARRRARATGRVSAAATAVRFSAVGLGCAGLIAAAIASAAFYRWVTWG